MKGNISSLKKIKNKSEIYTSNEENHTQMSTKRKRKKKSELNEEIKSESGKKIKLGENENKNLENDTVNIYNSNMSDQEDDQDIEISKDECNKYNGKYLRNLFNSSERLGALQKFIKLCKNNEKDLAAEYLDAGGSVLEILRILDSPDKKNLNNAAIVFSAMNIVIIKILAQYPQNQSSAEEACRHLINSHLASVHLMLASKSKPKHRKVVLKLLAAVVSLGGTLPRELLNHLSLHSQLVDFLISHSKPLDTENVRTCFIHFILAFLVNGSASDIRALLEKRGVLSSIFSGLIYDYSNIVQLVLTTVKKYILENSAISKSTKLFVFSTPVVQNIVNLYNWKGPKNWSGDNKQKFVTDHVDVEDKEITVCAVHDFLMTLLTSNRHGIAFHYRSLGIDSGRKHNQLINTILQSLDKPWEHSKPSELVVKILTACPDLIKSQLTYTEPFLIPRVSKNWVALMQFITKIINEINIESCLKLCSVDMTTMQTANATLSLILPAIVFKKSIIPALEHNNPLIHHEVINLLHNMILKIKSLVTTFENMKLNIAETSIFKNAVLENTSKLMPTFESILNIWTKAFSPEYNEKAFDTDEKNFYFDKKKHLLSILNFVQAYCEICPEILLTASTDSETNPTILLTNLSCINDIDEKELTIMKVKALKILLCSNISDFSPTEEIFSIALLFLITILGTENVSLKLEVHEALSILLNKCGIFEGYECQIEIWINAIAHFENVNEKSEIAGWINRIAKRVLKNNEKYTSLIQKIEENTGEEMVDVKKQDDIFNELSERSTKNVKLVQMLPLTSISLPLCAAIDSIKKSSSNVLSHYMSIILVHTLHCQVSLKAFTVLIEDLNIPVQKYLFSWLNSESPVMLKKPFNTNSVFRCVSKILLNQTETYEISTKENQLHIQLGDITENYALTNFEVKALLHMVIFYLTQLIQKFNVEVKNYVTFRNILLSLLKIAKEVDINFTILIQDCVKWIFKHPIILKYFKGIYKNVDTADNIITTLFMDICTLFRNFNQDSFILQLMQPYQEKFIRQVQSAIKNSNDHKKDANVHKDLIKLLQLNIEVVNDLLTSIITLPKKHFMSLDKSILSIWGLLLPVLIDQYSIRDMKNESNAFIKIDENLLKNIFVYLTDLKPICKQDFVLWENSLYEYLIKFPYNIDAIDKSLFTKLIKTNITSTTVKLLNLFIERNSQLIGAFIKCANNNDEIYQNKPFILSMVSSNLKYKWDQEFIYKLNELYKKDIILFLTGHQVPWIEDNIDSVLYIVEKSFDPQSSKDICNIISSNSSMLDAVKEGHIKLFNEIFKKSLAINSDALKDFILVLLYVTVTALKKDSKNITKLNFLCKTLIDSISVLKRESNFVFEELSKSHCWPQFTRIILKSGLKIPKENINLNSTLLQALTTTCNVAYIDNINEEYVKTIFQMTSSHSEFVNIMLSNASIKDDLVELLWILIKKNSTVLLPTHIPLYLASYNSTLNKSDQFILKILQHYESKEIKFDEYRPYLWGTAAASYYSVKGETDTALWRQPTTSQILDLLVPETVNNTIRNFPIHRNLKCDDVCAENNGHQLYDPAFYLPVFTYLLADNNVVAIHKVIHTGALALTIVACSSTCEQIRLAAYTVLSRFYFHLEATSSKEKPLWLHFIDSLRSGIVKTDLPLANVRLNSFVAIFLARTSLIMSQPLNSLYSSLQAFLMAKPALDLSTIPELLQLYYSSEIEHKAHRHWILEVIRDGLKTEKDMDVALRCVIFKMLFNFYTCTLSDRYSKNLILQIVRSATKLSKPCIILINGYALLPWLVNVTYYLNKGDVDSITCITEIVNNILSALHQSKLKESYYHLQIMKVLLSLKIHFNQSVTAECLNNFINVINKTIINNVVSQLLTNHDLKDIVNYSKQFLQSVSEYEALLQFGCKFVKRKSNENQSSLEDCLYNLIINWYNFNKSSK